MTAEQGDLPAVVVDANLLVKTLLDEPESDAALAAVAAAAEAQIDLLSPPLVRYEVGDALVRAMQVRIEETSPEEVEEDLRQLLTQVSIVEDSDEIVPLALRHRLTYYDATYLALAKARGTPLWTYDEALLRAAKAERIPTSSPGAPAAPRRVYRP